MPSRSSWRWPKRCDARVIKHTTPTVPVSLHFSSGIKRRIFGSQHYKIFLKTAVFRVNTVRNVGRRRPWRNAGPGETVTAGHVATSHQDVALFTRSFADLGSESSSARKVPRSKMDASTVTPSESDSAVRARLRYSGPCHQIRSYP